MKNRIIPYPLLLKYTDVTDDELDKLIKNYSSGSSYKNIAEVLERETNIDKKIYNVKLNQWNYHNIPLEDIHFFIENDYEYVSHQLLRDMDEYDTRLYHSARLLNCLNIGFTLPHTLRVYHYHDERSFGMTYRELKTGDQDKLGKPIKILKKLPWIKPIDEKLLIGFNDYLKGKYNSEVVIQEVSGEKIREWYHGKMYAPNSGTLNESCMRHGKCQDYFDIYTENPGVRMIIATKNDQLMGRAIVWDRSLWNKNYFDNVNAVVDRIYGNESTISQIKQYCAKNNYVHKDRQSYQEPMAWIHYVNGVAVNKDKIIRINIDTEFDQYPYMDTFKYCSDDYITNCDSLSYNIELTDTDGYNHNETCYYCEEEINEDESCSTYNGDRSCTDCCNYVESHDAYYHRDDTVYSEYNDQYLHSDDAYNTEYDHYIHCDDALTSFDDYYVHTNDAVLSYNDDGNDIFVDKDNCKSFFIGDVEFYWSINMSKSTLYEFIKYVFLQNLNDISIAKIVIVNVFITEYDVIDEETINEIVELYNNNNDELQTNN